ncbi:TPA: hypothetical protein ACHVI3_000884 [Streptococcus suis]
MVSKYRRCSLVLSLFLGLSSCLCACSQTDASQTSLVIEGQAVPKQELQREVLDQKNSVGQYYFQKYQAEIDTEFWTKDFSGEKPLEDLSKIVLENLRHQYAARSLAVQSQVIDKIDYAAFYQRFQDANNQRQSAIQSGQLVYGVNQFSESIFLGYELDQFKSAYTANEQLPDMQVSDEDALAYYEAEKDRLFWSYDDMNFQYIRVYYGSLDLRPEEVDKIRSDMETIRTLLESGVDMEVAIQDYPHLKEYYSEEDLLSGEVSSYYDYIGEVLDIALELQADEISPVTDQNTSLVLVKMKNKTEHDYVPFEEVRSVIDKHIREERYLKLLDKKSKELEVKVDQEVLENVIKNIVNP